MEGETKTGLIVGGLFLLFFGIMFAGIFNMVNEENEKKDFCIENGWDKLDRSTSKTYEFRCLKYIDNKDSLGSKKEYSDWITEKEMRE